VTDFYTLPGTPSDLLTSQVVGERRMKVSSGSTITVNDSAVALGIGATFTGNAVDVSAYPSVVVAVKTDKAGTLYVEFSPNGTDWDSSLSFSVAADTNEIHRLTVTRQFFRVRFTNTSGEAQGFMRLQCLAGSQAALTSSLNSVVQADADATLVRTLDFNLMVSEGLYQNRNATIKDGINFDIDTGSVPEDVTAEGGVYTGFPISPVAGEIVVAAADTGTVYYSYMATNTDTDYVFASKAVAGAGTYALDHNIWRCNFAYFVKDSDTLLNAGNITVQAVGGANVFCLIPAGYSQSFCAAYTVPFGSSIHLDRITGNLRGSTSGTMDCVFWVRPFGESPRYRFPFELQFGTLYFDDVDYLIRIPARTDLIPRVLVSSANNMVAKVSYRLIKVKA